MDFSRGKKLEDDLDNPYYVSSMRKRQILSKINRSIDLQKKTNRERDDSDQSPYAKIFKDQDALQDSLNARLKMPDQVVLP